MAKRKRSGIRLLLWLGAIALLLMVVTTVGVVLLVGESFPPLDKEARWLHYRVSPMTADSPGNEGLFMDPLDMPPLTSEVTAALRHAAEDEQISGLFLEVGGSGMGWAQTQDMRDAIAAFRASGKPCVAWGDALGNKEYYLASACGEVHLAPAGLVLVNGLSVTQMYYQGAFERFGISANFEHVGDFKSAIEPYQRSGPSEPAAQAMNLLLDSLYEQLVAGIAEGRQWELHVAQAVVDDPPMNPRAALEVGLVDGLSFRDEVLEESAGDERTTMSAYLRDRRIAWGSGGKTIAIIHAEGTIIGGSSAQDVFGGRYVGDRSLRKQLTQVREDDDIAAVVLRVNSPGGSGSASDAIWREVSLTQEVKPVIVSMGDYAASGGYYISMGADRIYAQPGTLTGSIGVFGGKINPSGALEDLGLAFHTYERGAHSTLLSGTHDFDEAGRAKFQSFLSGFYEIFVTKAADGRGMTYDELHAVAQGRVWTGEQALERGLVDELGSLDDALAHAASVAAVEGDYAVQRFPERQSFLDALFAEMESPEEAALGPLAVVPGAKEALGELTRLDRVLADGNVAALSPASGLRFD